MGVSVSIIHTDELNNTPKNSNSSNPPSLTGSPPQVKNITLHRGSDGLGFSIVGGYGKLKLWFIRMSAYHWGLCLNQHVGSPHGNLPIYVKTVFSKGAGMVSGLKRGDQILAVNTVPCEGLTHQDAVALLKSVKGNVNLTILSWIFSIHILIRNFRH